MRQELIGVLESEHRRIEGLLAQGQELPADAEQSWIVVREIFRELIPHILTEESLLYPRLKQHPDLNAVGKRSEDRHHDVKQRVLALQSSKAGGADWQARLLELKRSVEQYLRGKEVELFPRLRAVLSESERHALGVMFQRERNQLAQAS